MGCSMGITCSVINLGQTFSCIGPLTAPLKSDPNASPPNIYSMSFPACRQRRDAIRIANRCPVQSVKTLVDLTVSGSEFSELKNIIKTQNDEFLRKAEHAAGEALDTWNRAMKEDFGQRCFAVIDGCGDSCVLRPC